jgi:apolipoprotein N-acyltransferase
MRSWWLTGFPWNPIGSAWTVSDAMIQSTAVIGTYGLSLLTVAAAAMPAELVRAPGRRSRAWPAVTALALLALIWAAGAVRLAQAPTQAPVAGVWLRLVQPNIPQSLKWRRELLDQHLRQQIGMSRAPASPAPTHVIWSEAAAPLFLAEDPQRLADVGAATPEGGVSIVGTLRRTPPGEPPVLANSLVAIDPGGTIVASYDKSHLVPFGEYMPLRGIVPLPAVAAGMADFAPGPGITTMRLEGLPPFSPLICYEVIFPARVASRQDRPAWLLNLTNDGWYGQSAGPYQHFALSRLRAVEEGLPLVRVANTGISGIVDAYGRIVDKLALGVGGVLDGPLPPPLPSATVYGRFGNAVPFALILLFAIAGAVLSRRK